MDSSAPEVQPVLTAFYNRYYGYLFTVVTSTLKTIYDPDAIREVIHDALIAFLQKAYSFKFPANADDTTCDKLIRVYLGQLATWKARDARGFQMSFGRDTIEAEELEKQLNSVTQVGYAGTNVKSAPEKEARLAAVEAWMSSLSPLESDVVRTYFLDDHAGQKSARLPDGVAQQLAKKHQTTEPNLRYQKSKLQKVFEAKFGIPGA